MHANGREIATVTQWRYVAMTSERNRRGLGLVGLAAAVAMALSGCVYRHESVATPATTPTTTIVTTPSATPSAAVVVTTPRRTVAYSQGRYELYGNGTTIPYYWVWVPAGSTLPAPPPPPTP
jgi:hypothetical protein